MVEFPEFVITLCHDKCNEKQVTLAFVLGLKGIEKGYKTAILLMLDGVHVGVSGYVEDIDIGEPFLPVKDLLEVYMKQGGQLFVCGSCWKHEHLADGDRLEGVPLISADQVVDFLMKAKTTLQLN
jgi:tRNA 2-thiouridine synthesizing protein D